MIKLQKNVLHYPRLDTVLMVEKVLQEADLAISKNELLRRLPKQIMRPTLNVILLYLETKGHVMTGEKGILWIHNDNPKMKKLLAKSIEA